MRLSRYHRSSAERRNKKKTKTTKKNIYRKFWCMRSHYRATLFFHVLFIYLSISISDWSSSKITDTLAIVLLLMLLFKMNRFAFKGLKAHTKHTWPHKLKKLFQKGKGADIPTEIVDGSRRSEFRSFFFRSFFLSLLLLNCTFVKLLFQLCVCIVVFMTWYASFTLRWICWCRLDGCRWLWWWWWRRRRRRQRQRWNSLAELKPKTQQRMGGLIKSSNWKRAK